MACSIVTPWATGRRISPRPARRRSSFRHVARLGRRLGTAYHHGPALRRGALRRRPGLSTECEPAGDRRLPIRTRRSSGSRTISSPARTSTRSNAPRISSSAGASWWNSANRRALRRGSHRDPAARVASRGWRIFPATRCSSARISRAGSARGTAIRCSRRPRTTTGAPATTRLFYSSLQGDLGRALDADNELSLGGDNGLRGYPLRYQSGAARGLLTVEERFFTKWYPWHLFNVGAAVFADVGRTFGARRDRTPQLGTLRDVGVRPAHLQFPFRAGQRAARRRRVSAGRRFVAAEPAVPDRDQTQLLIRGLTHARTTPFLARFWPLIILAAWYVCAGAALRLVLSAQFGFEQQVSAAGAAVDRCRPARSPMRSRRSIYSRRSRCSWRCCRIAGAPRAPRASASSPALSCGCSGSPSSRRSEYFFFEEFDARLNLVAVDYLMYPTEVVGDIWSEYPVVTVLAVSAPCCAALVCVLLRWQLADAARRRTLRRRTIAARFGAFAGARRRSAALTFESSIARPVATIASRTRSRRTARAASSARCAPTRSTTTPTTPAARPRTESHGPRVAHLGKEGGEFTRLAEGRLDRSFPATADGLGKLNVVVIASESFGAEFSKLYGCSATGRRSSIASRSRACGSGTCTPPARARCAASKPSPRRSRRCRACRSLRRPGNEGIANWGTVMRAQGYNTSFLYGGYGYFDNMNYFFAQQRLRSARPRADRRNPCASRTSGAWRTRICSTLALASLRRPVAGAASRSSPSS